MLGGLQLWFGAAVEGVAHAFDGVHIAPARAEEFAAAHAGAQGQHDQGVQLGAADGFQQAAGLGGGEGFDALAASGADLDVAGDVPGEVVFADGVLEPERSRACR